ncbi:MAG TPA: 3-deoxy-manno-octulosonate cytidylyltransferase [Ignavibacteria bacterium]
MKVLGLIPSRYKSTRLPGKPLINIDGMSMIERVYKRASKAKYIDELIVATDNEMIFNEVKRFGGKVMMTSLRHRSGTDRIAEIAKKTNFEIIVNIQGDEPFIPPTNIDKVIAPMLRDRTLKACTLAIRFKDIYDVMDINKVKVVLDKDNYAVYFSRSIIPFNTNASLSKLDLKKTKYYKHIGLYAFRKEFLIEFSKMKVSDLENSEKLEQLRIIENGEKIKVITTTLDSYSIDTMQDFEKIKHYCK